MEQQKIIYKKALAEQIRRLCVKKGISITSLESEVGYSQGMISRWMSADKNEDFNVLTKLSAMADRFGISMDELLERVQVEPPPEPCEFPDLASCLIKASECGKLKWYVLNGNSKSKTLFEQIPAHESGRSPADMWMAEQDRMVFLLVSWCDDIDNASEPIEFELYGFVEHGIPPYAIKAEKKGLETLYTHLRIQRAYQSLQSMISDKTQNF